MNELVTFNERLTELMFNENNLTLSQLSEKIGVSSATICLWKEGKRTPFLFSAIKLADYFQCSLDFLFGRTDKILDFTIQPILPLYDRLLSILEKQGISRYRIIKDIKFPKRNFESWRDGRKPLIQTLIDIANYLDVTLDYLVGRDR